MKYQQGKLPRKSKVKPLLWLLLLVISIAYGITVGCWWIEGNQRMVQPNANTAVAN